VLGATLVIGASLWLGFFSFRHVDYSRELWWRFAFFEGDAPRFLRASVVSVTGALAFGLLHLMRPARVEPGLPAGRSWTPPPRWPGGRRTAARTWRWWATRRCCSTNSGPPS